MAKTNPQAVKDSKRGLVSQLATSAYLARASRLREMFMYISSRVLDDSAEEIHEQEIGQEVFGRPADYDTAADNIVRVHASMLRKRLGQYFENEGSQEPMIIEIPRGNYAPVFRERPKKPAEPEPQSVSAPARVPEPASRIPLWVSTALAVIFAATSIALYVHSRNLAKFAPPRPTPAVAEFWSQLFPAGKPTDIVLSDASLGIVQDRLDHPISLSEYFDRSYLNSVDSRAAEAKLDPVFTKSLLLKREVNYGEVSLLARITDMARSVQGETKVRFARDYSFRDLKANNALLLGSGASDPWIEPLQNRLTIRWKFDAASGTTYPVDLKAPVADQGKYHELTLPDGSHEGYATISLLPNLNSTGNVLVVSATGGTAMNAALDFLCDEHSLTELRSQLAPKSAVTSQLPYFELLLRVSGRNTLPRNSGIILLRRIA